MSRQFYKFVVIETITVERHYTVRAESESEARESAAFGATVKEVTIKERDVIDRQIVERLR